MNELLKYSGFIENALKEKYAYKFRAFVWSVSSFIFLLIQFYLWKAIFASNGNQLAGIQISKYIIYIGIGFFTYNLTSCFLELQISEEVKKGDVSNHLLKPFSYGKMILARHLGNKLGELITLVPILIVVVIMFSISDFHLVTTLYYLLSLVLTFVLVFLLSYLIGILSFWVKNIWGLHLLKTGLMVIFSGQIIAIDIIRSVGKNGLVMNPMNFIPNGYIQNFFLWIYKITFYLPFQSMYYTPTAIFSGLVEKQQDILQLIGLQVFWIVVLYAITKLIWRMIRSKIDILGG